MNPLLGKTLLRVTVFYAYGSFVAWIFTVIEKRDESSHERMERTLKELRKEMNLKYNMTESDFGNLVNKTAEAIKEGDNLDWTFLNSAGFVFAALTTIGYGHITPKTPVGQGITILFCLLGIPITMLAMKSAGELWACCFEFLVIKTETALLKRAQTTHVKKKTFFLACTSIVIVLITAAVSTTYLENWTFMEGLYAWFITLTTIGFGDYVHLEALQKEVDKGLTPETSLILYGLLLSLPYMVGLSLMSCILSIIVDSIDHIRNFRDRLLNCCPSIIRLRQKLFCHKGSSNEANDAALEDDGRNCPSQDRPPAVV